MSVFRSLHTCEQTLRRQLRYSRTIPKRHTISEGWECVFENCRPEEKLLIINRLGRMEGIKFRQGRFLIGAKKKVSKAIAAAKELVHVTDIPGSEELLREVYISQLLHLAKSVGQDCVVARQWIGFISPKDKFKNIKIIVTEAPLSQTQRVILNKLYGVMATENLIISEDSYLLQQKVMVATSSEALHESTLNDALQKTKIIAISLLSPAEKKLCGVFLQPTNASGWVALSLRKMLKGKGIPLTAVTDEVLCLFFDRGNEKIARSMVRAIGSVFTQRAEFYSQNSFSGILDACDGGTIVLCRGDRVSFLGPSDQSVGILIKHLLKKKLLYTHDEILKCDWGSEWKKTFTKVTNIQPGGWVAEQLCKTYGGSITKKDQTAVFTSSEPLPTSDLIQKGELSIFRSSCIPNPPSGVMFVVNDNRTLLALIGDAEGCGSELKSFEDDGSIRNILLPSEWNQPLDKENDYLQQLEEELKTAAAEALTLQEQSLKGKEKAIEEAEVHKATEIKKELQECHSALEQVALKMKSNIPIEAGIIDDFLKQKPLRTWRQSDTDHSIELLKIAEAIKRLSNENVVPLLVLSQQLRTRFLNIPDFKLKTYSYWNTKIMSAYLKYNDWIDASPGCQLDVQILKSIKELKNIPIPCLDTTFMLQTLPDDGRIRVFDTSSLMYLSSTKFPEGVKIVIPYTALSELINLTTHNDSSVSEPAKIAYESICQKLLSDKHFGTVFVVGPIQEIFYVRKTLLSALLMLQKLSDCRSGLRMSVPDDRILSCAYILKLNSKRFCKTPPPITLFTEDIELSKRADILQVGISKPPLLPS